MQSPITPCLPRVAGEGAVRASVCGRGGVDGCVRGVCPVEPLVGGTWHWARRAEYEVLDTLPSNIEGKKKKQKMWLFDSLKTEKKGKCAGYLVVSRVLRTGVEAFTGARTGVTRSTWLQIETGRNSEQREIKQQRQRG